MLLTPILEKREKARKDLPFYFETPLFYSEWNKSLQGRHAGKRKAHWGQISMYWNGCNSLFLKCRHSESKGFSHIKLINLSDLFILFQYLHTTFLYLDSIQGCLHGQATLLDDSVWFLQILVLVSWGSVLETPPPQIVEWNYWYRQTPPTLRFPLSLVDVPLWPLPGSHWAWQSKTWIPVFIKYQQKQKWHYIRCGKCWSPVGAVCRKAPPIQSADKWIHGAPIEYSVIFYFHIHGYGGPCIFCESQNPPPSGVAFTELWFLWLYLASVGNCKSSMDRSSKLFSILCWLALLPYTPDFVHCMTIHLKSDGLFCHSGFCSLSRPDILYLIQKHNDKLSCLDLQAVSAVQS